MKEVYILINRLTGYNTVTDIRILNWKLFYRFIRIIYDRVVDFVSRFCRIWTFIYPIVTLLRSTLELGE